MPLATNAKRALIILAAVMCVAAVLGAGFYWYSVGRGIGSEIGSNRTPVLFTELPPDAPAAAYVDVAAFKKLQTSPLATILGLAGAAPPEDEEYAQFVADTGFDYTRDLNAVALAFWPGDFGPASKSSAENRVLAVADGRFDQQKIKAYALRTGKEVMHGTKSTYEVPGDPAVSFQFLSASRISIASGTNAMESGERRESNTVTSIQMEAERVAGAPLFALARTKNLPDSFYLNFHSSPQLERLARSVQLLTLAGQPGENQILVTLDAQCDSTQNAFELATLLDGARMIGVMALTDPKTRGQMTQGQIALLNALISDAKVSHQDTWVRLKVTIAPEMLGAPVSGDSREKPLSRQRSLQ